MCCLRSIKDVVVRTLIHSPPHPTPHHQRSIKGVFQVTLTGVVYVVSRTVVRTLIHSPTPPHPSVTPQMVKKCIFDHGELWAVVQLHGKRRIERRPFFQPLRVHFPCVFSGFFACPFFGSFQILRKTTSFLQCFMCKCSSLFITSLAGRELNFDTLR